MKSFTTIILLALFNSTVTTVLAKELVGDRDCVIKKKNDCQAAAQTLNMNFKKNTAKEGDAWGCIIPNGENYVEWNNGKGADGKTKRSARDSSFTRVYCGLEEEAQEEEVKATSPPTKAPTTSAPSSAPTITSSSSPTNSPTESPTTSSPTASPTESPTTASPTDSPTESPTTNSPTESPTKGKTGSPTDEPTASRKEKKEEKDTLKETVLLKETVKDILKETAGDETIPPSSTETEEATEEEEEVEEEVTEEDVTEDEEEDESAAPSEQTTKEATSSPTTEDTVPPTLSPTLAADPTDAPKVITCYDYTNVIELGQKECTSHSLYVKIREEFNRQQEEADEDCKGGLHTEMWKLTGSPEDWQWYAYLQTLCDAALKKNAADAPTDSWSSLEGASIDLEEYFEGGTFLNDETGNFQQDVDDLERHGGYDRFGYVGEDTRLNDYMRTTEESYAAGKAIMTFSGDEAKTSYLSSPTTGFENGCAETNAAVCCWHRDRQYYDNNGHCHFGWCKDKDPGDNTDLCWIEEVDDADDANDKAKWNNLFFVSMYDHLYQRGYVDSITDDPKIAGSQAMCGCVEDMNPIARADCTMVVARSEYKAYQDENTGLLVVESVPGSFELEFKACEGYDYDESITPEAFAEFDYNPHSAGLTRQNNDLSAYVFRQYLEGKVDESHTEALEKTIIGYRDPTVNDGDEEREIACKAAFEKRYPDKEWVERELDIEIEEE